MDSDCHLSSSLIMSSSSTLATVAVAASSSVVPRYNVTFVGPSRSGKTQLISQKRYGSFSDTYVPTLGVEFTSWLCAAADPSVQLAIWDASGDVRYQSISMSHFCAAQVIVYVFDASSVDCANESLHNLELLASAADCSRASSRRRRRDVIRLLVANKVDSETRCTRWSNIDTFMQRHCTKDTPLYWCSPRTNTGVDALFDGILSQLRTRRIKPISYVHVGGISAANRTSSRARSGSLERELATDDALCTNVDLSYRTASTTPAVRRCSSRADDYDDDDDCSDAAHYYPSPSPLQISRYEFVKSSSSSWLETFKSLVQCLLCTRLFAKPCST